MTNKEAKAKATTEVLRFAQDDKLRRYMLRDDSEIAGGPALGATAAAVSVSMGLEVRAQMPSRRAEICLVVLFIMSRSLPVAAQVPRAASDSQAEPQFEAVTIKHPDPAAQYHKAGFYGTPGGRVFLGVNVRMLVEYAFDLRDFQVAGGPEWVNAGWSISEWYDINAVPPDSSASRKIPVANAEPTSEQRAMLRSVLRERFGFRYHMEMREGEVYFLVRGAKKLALSEPKHPDGDPRAIVFMKQGGIVDGEAEGTNTTMDYVAARLSERLRIPVINQTGISGSYDFYLPPSDPENRDMATAVISVMDRLGLKLKKGRGAVETLVIDAVERPTEN